MMMIIVMMIMMIFDIVDDDDDDDDDDSFNCILKVQVKICLYVYFLFLLLSKRESCAKHSLTSSAYKSKLKDFFRFSNFFVFFCFFFFFAAQIFLLPAVQKNRWGGEIKKT